MNPKDAQRFPRFIQFSIAAAHEAVLDSKLQVKTFDEDVRWGTCIGVGLGGLSETEANHDLLREKGPKRVSPFFIPMTIPNMAAGLVAEQFRLRGPNMCTATACASGSHAIGEGFRYISENFADVMVCGGAESTITPLGIAAFASMKALSKNNEVPDKASRPFDLDRDGFVMGEGAGLIVLEELEHARARGAKIYAEIVGYGLSGDAYHMTSPAPEGVGGQRAMVMALSRAGIDGSAVQYINAHGTSTKLNDEYETHAIAQVFGEAAPSISISSTKGATGHCIGAAGGIEAIFSVKAIEEGMIPPTINYVTKDPNCYLDYTPNEPRRREVNFAMSNSFGFGGINATLIFKHFS
jgi:3-oxoacyl-[acyl-carrier-protein] synthase II